VLEHGLPGLLLCTARAGAILFLLGALRLGTLIRFIPHPVTTGFTCGIAVTIALTQVKEFLGLPISEVPAEFFPKLAAFAGALDQVHLPTLGVALAAAITVKAWPRRWRRFVPGSIVAVVAGTTVVHLAGLPLETIGDRFGAAGIPSGLPRPALPHFDWAELPGLLRPAIAIALLGAIESLLSAVVADGMIDDRHDSNQELMAQGVANLVVPFFGGIPVTGVIARTATNVRNGAGSPVAGIVHALTLLAIVLVAAPLARFIPLAVLAAILVAVAIDMGDWAEFRTLPHQPRSDALVFLVTFVLTVVFDLTVAVEVGMLLAAGLFIRRVAETTRVDVLEPESAAAQGHERLPSVPRGVLVYRVFGALLFGAVDKLDNVIRRTGADTRVVVLHLAAVTALDGTALNAMETLHEKLRRHGKHLVLSGPHTQPYFAMEKSGFLEAVGEVNVCADLDAAVACARELLEKQG
jgi:SulP family sulfate permease